MNALTPPTMPGGQRGLTLIELMVGLTLGLIVTSSLLALLANASINGQDIARAGMQIENGRYVSELLREDLRMAGFFGETSTVSAVYETPDPCATTPTGWNGAPFTLPTPVRGYEPNETLGCLENRKAGTAAIAVRYVGINAISPSPPELPASGNTAYHVQYSFCVDDVSAPRFVFSTNPAAFTLRNRACTAVNKVRPYFSRVYYVASCNRCGTGGDSTPTLKRVDLVGDQLVTTAVADGIDNLQIEYGFDIDNNGSADQYLTTLGTTAGTTTWANVMALKVHFITRSLDKATGTDLATDQEFELGGTGTFNVAADGFTRKAYSSVIRLINPSGTREVP